MPIEYKRVDISMPEELLREIDIVARLQKRNRSELLRECFRFFKEHHYGKLNLINEEPTD